jgi:baculoviral IAP repeat-containing protein 6
VLQVLASYIDPGGENNHEYCVCEEEESSLLPAALPELLSQSCLVPAISSYLRNDSGTTMTCLISAGIPPCLHFSKA